MAEVNIQKQVQRLLDAAMEKSARRDFALALDELKAAEAIDRENPVILYNLGICYIRTDLHRTAINYLERILQLPYTFVDVVIVRKLLAYCFLMTKDYQEALKQLDESLKISSRDTMAMSMKGYCLEQLDDIAGAMSIFREIIGIDPNNYNSYNSLAYLMCRSGDDLTSALKFAKKAVDANPDNPAYLDTMGYIYMKKGQNDRAKKYFKKAYSLMPDSEEIRMHVKQFLKIDEK
jgi:tetratricopeptide (TPR) repeat protein